MGRNDPAVNWLLHSEDLSIQYLTLTEVIGEPEESKEVQTANKRVTKGPRLRALLAGLRRESRNP